MNLELNNISKSFGEKEVLKEINLSIQSGKAYGILGRNGAGKTTTIRIIMGVFPADEGTVTIDGQSVSKANISFGYLPEERGLYPKKIIKEQLIYIGKLRGMKAKEADANAQKWLDRLEASEYYNKTLDSLSKGNQQKIQLAAAIINDPQIVILDEPFSGLDPINANLLKSVVRELVDAGKIVLFSSHQMSYVEEFCDNIALLNNGRIVLEGNLRTIKRAYERNKIKISVDEKLGTAIEIIPKVVKNSHLSSRIKKIEQVSGGCIVDLTSQSDKDDLLKTLLSENIGIEKFEVLEPTLEQIFVEKAGENI